jgi:polyisoprenyl-phosphate glycosyltransferase
MSKALLTVLCPVFNEQQTIPLFYQRMKPVLMGLKDRYDTNLIFLDNGSTDRTHELVKDICLADPNCFTIVLSRNFGYQCSVECGLRNAAGDLFVVIDVDCEDPPEMLPDFLKYYEDGFDITYGERLDREEGALMKFGRKMYYRFTRLLADEHFILDMAEFCLITREVRDAILRDNNSFPFIRASIGRIGFNVKNVPYKRQKRVAGETHYNFFRMAVFAIAGVLSSSTFPLRVPAYTLPIYLLLLAAICVTGIFSGGSWFLPAVLFTGFGFCGYSVASISMYLARVYKNGLNRPNFVINLRKSRFQPEGKAVALGERLRTEAS